MDRSNTMTRFSRKSAAAFATALITTLAGCASHGVHTSEGLAVAQERMASIKAATQWDMARQQFLTGDLEKALKSVNNAIAANPSVAKSHSLRGRILIEMGQLEQALRSLKQALAINPDFEEGHYFMGVIYERFSEYDMALSAYEAAGEIAPDDPQYAIAAAEMQIELGKLDDAEALLQAGSDTFKHNAGVRQTLGHIALLRNQPKRAVTYFGQAHLLAPDDDSTLEDLAFAQMAAGDFANAERSLEQLRSDPETAKRNDLKRLHARALVELNRPVEARTLLLELAQDSSEASDAQLWIDLAAVALLIDDWRRVRHAAARAISLAPNRYEGHMYLAAWSRHRGDMDAALSNLNKAISLSKSDATPTMMKGLILQELGRRSDAARAYAIAAKMRQKLGQAAIASVEDDND